MLQKLKVLSNILRENVCIYAFWMEPILFEQLHNITKAQFSKLKCSIDQICVRLAYLIKLLPTE